MATPTLALIPTGYKAGKLYSVLPESGVGDFTVVRATEGTRVNENGLIESMGVNVPRLDYTNGGCPVLLTEPQSTNLITYSEDFSNAYWNKTNVTVISNDTTSPDGTLNADKLVASSSSSIHKIRVNNLTATINQFYTIYVFAKKGEYNYIQVSDDNNAGSEAMFNLDTGDVVSFSSGAVATTELIGGFYKCSVTYQALAVGLYPSVYLSSDGINLSFLGDGTSGVYIFGASLENLSYATSYIPTTGSAVTRNADQVYGAGDAATFNDSEGVLMAEISALNDTVTDYNSIGLGNTSVFNRMGLGFQQPSSIYVYKHDGSNSWLPFQAIDINSLNKVALSYKTNDNHLWINGFKIASNTTVGDASSLNELKFEASYGLEDFYGKTSQIQYFDTSLTDLELEKLTSWASFSDMANALNYTIY